jgi:hypothetical protein
MFRMDMKKLSASGQKKTTRPLRPVGVLTFVALVAIAPNPS